MTRLIGSRWKRREAWSRGVLIRPVSRAEPWKTQSSFSIDFTFMSCVALAKRGVPFVARKSEVGSRIQSDPSLSSAGFWCLVGGVTPVLFPNTAVKPSRGDGTHLYRWGE